MEILQDALIIFCCHTYGVVVIELFVRICLLACVSCVTCMEWLAQLGRFNRLRCALSSSAFVAQVLMLRHFEKNFFLVLCGFNRWLESDSVFLCTAQCPGHKAMAF